MACKHLTIIPDASPSVAGRCGIGEGGGIPTHGFCRRCPKNTDPVKQPTRTTVTRVPVATSVSTHIASIPRDKWPAWATGMALAAIPEDVGIGDVVHRLAGPANKITDWLKEKGIADCGCGNRRIKWNLLYPLK